jgi:excisionase family DNA binding protein
LFSGFRRICIPAGKSDTAQEKLFSIELLTIQQVANWAKVSPKTIYRWIETGQTPVVKFGNRTYRIPTGAVIKQLQQAGYKHLMGTKDRA